MRISRKVRIVQLFAVLGVPLFFAGCASPSKPRLSADEQAEALSHFSLGMLAVAGDNPAAALEHLQAAIRLDPDEDSLYAPAVSVALELKQPQEAVRLAQKLVKRYPNTGNPALLLARVYALTGKPDEAEKLFRKILTDFPENPDAPALLARLYLSQDRHADSLEILRSAVMEQPDQVELLSLLGMLCIESARNLDGNPAAQTAAIDEGIGFLRQALDRNPDNPIVWQQIGLALMAVNRPEEALTALQKARHYAPEDVHLAGQMLGLLIQTGTYDDAISACESLSAETGTDPELWIEYLAEQTPASEYPRLIQYLESRIREQIPAPASFYARLSALYFDSGENEKADTLLSEALSHYPSDNRLRMVLGFLHLRQERYDLAYTELNQVRAEAPETEWANNPFYLYNFLVAAQKSDHLEEAARTLSRTYTNNPAVLNQYMRSLLTGKSPVSTESAMELLEVFHTQSPKAAEALYYLMVLQTEQKEYAKAVETAEKFEGLANKTGATNLLSGPFYYQYAALHERTGQLEIAEKLFFKAIDSGEQTVTAAAQNYIAYMWAERGEKLDAGLKLIQKALEFDPENGAFLDTLGWIYYMQGRYSEALTELEKARDAVAVDPAVWEHLGDTWLKLGNREEASRHWKKALELDPESQKLIDRLEEIGVKPDADPVPANSPADTMHRP